jgi:hypothetical protein
MKIPSMTKEGRVVCLKNKYGAKKITDLETGFVFDSKREYRRWQELRFMEKNAQITGLQRQVKFVLIPAQYERYERFSTKTGKRLKDGIRCLEKEVSYVADFVYEKAGKTIVEDSKGFRTADYIIKRKLLLQVYGIKVREV